MNLKFPDFDHFIVVMKENVLILRKFTYKYLGIYRHDVSNILSNDSRRKLHVNIDEI